MMASTPFLGFWISVGFIGWVYLGFPLVLALRRTRPAPRRDPDTQLPHISYVIVVHNERAVIEDKLENVESLDYPRDRLQVILASDGSDDGTNECVATHAGPTPIELVRLQRVGKNAALNAAVALATGEVLVFSDADSMLEPAALRTLVAPFQDPEIGGVGGDYEYEKAVAGGASERRYWSLDRIWKALESRSGNMTSATGQIYAIRRVLFTPVPDGVTDDFYVSTGVISAGRRLWFEAAAVARGPVSETTEAEYRRKVRLMTRGFASVWARRQLLNPGRYGFYALQLATHKIARRLVGLPLIAILVSAPLLFGAHPIYALATVAQAGLYGLALGGWLLRNTPAGRSPALALPLFFVMVNWAGLRAGWDFLRGRRHRVWVPDRTPSGRDMDETLPPSPEGG